MRPIPPARPVSVGLDGHIADGIKAGPRERAQRRAILLDQRRDGGGLFVVRAGPVGLAPGQQRLIERRKVGDLGAGNQQVTAQVAHLVFDVPLLVAAIGVAEGDREAVVGLEALEELRETNGPRHFPAHRRGVVEDEPWGYPAEAFEHGLEPGQQTFRRFPTEQLEVPRIAVGDTHGEMLAGLWHAVQDRFSGAAVPRTLPRMPDPLQGAGGRSRRPQTFHIPLDDRIRANKVRILRAEALEEALGRVALLVERARIVGEPLLNHGVIGIEFRRSGARRGGG